MVRGRDGRARRPPTLPLPFSFGMYCGCFVLASLVFSFLVLVLVACNAFAVVLVSFPLGLLSDMVRWFMARMALAAGRSAGAQTRYAVIGCGTFGETTVMARAAVDGTDFGGPAAAASSDHARECVRLAAVIAESARYRRMPLSGSMPVIAIAGVLKTITETVGPAGVMLAFLATVVLVGVQGAARPALSLVVGVSRMAGGLLVPSALSWPSWPWLVPSRSRQGAPAWSWAAPSWLWSGAPPLGGRQPDAMVGEEEDERTDDVDEGTQRTAAMTLSTSGHHVVAHRPITRSEARKMKGEAEALTAHNSSWR